MPVSIFPLGEADIPGAVDAIQQAFANDPYKLWVFNDREKGVPCRWGIRNALFYVAKDSSSDEPEKVLGIACWLPPKSVELHETWAEWLEGWRLWVNQVGMNLWYGRGGLNVKRYYIWKTKQAEAHSEIWTDPRGYYFLNIMVVVPEEQGKGIGKMLAREVTKKADEEGRKCYLESSRDVPNIGIYEAMGFHFVKEMNCDDGGERTVSGAIESRADVEAIQGRRAKSDIPRRRFAEVDTHEEALKSAITQLVH